MLAAKPINDQLGINLTENLENYGAIHVPAQLLEQPGRAVVSALPLIGHLRPEALCSRDSCLAPSTQPHTPGQRAAVPALSQGLFCAVVKGRDGRAWRDR